MTEVISKGKIEHVIKDHIHASMKDIIDATNKAYQKVVSI